MDDGNLNFGNRCCETLCKGEKNDGDLNFRIHSCGRGEKKHPIERSSNGVYQRMFHCRKQLDLNQPSSISEGFQHRIDLNDTHR